jgi:hypothetical protein
MMSNRQRILAILDGKSPDRLPWVPRLKLWYDARVAEGTMPTRYRGLSLRGLERAMGTGTPARDGRIVKARHEGVEIRWRERDSEILTEFITPVGTVSKLGIKSGGIDSLADEDVLPKTYPITRIEDYAVVEYIYEHTYYEPTYQEYEAYERAVGEDGYPMVFAGDCPFHHFLLYLAGYSQGYFELADHTAQVEHLFRVMEQVDMERLWPLVLNSPARLILHGMHFDTQMTPPPLFERYIKPYYERIAPALHDRNKRLAYHADDDSKAILGLVKQSGFDFADCLCTAPMVTVTLEEARAAWGSDMIIYGGVPSVLLQAEFSDQEFEDYMSRVFRAVAPGDAFILGVSDNVMPDAMIARVERISELVWQRGGYPIRA